MYMYDLQTSVFIKKYYQEKLRQTEHVPMREKSVWYTQTTEY